MNRFVQNALWGQPRIGSTGYNWLCEGHSLTSLQESFRQPHVREHSEISFVGDQILCFRDAFYAPADQSLRGYCIPPWAKTLWRRAIPNLRSDHENFPRKAPHFILTDRNDPSALDLNTDGYTFSEKLFFGVLVGPHMHMSSLILYGDRAYPFSGYHVTCHGEWSYSIATATSLLGALRMHVHHSGIKPRAIRFRETGEGRYEIQAFEENEYLFPEQEPVLIRTPRGDIHTIHRFSKEEGLIVDEHGHLYSHDESGIREIDIYIITPRLERYNPDLWNRLPRPRGARLPKTFTTREIYFAEGTAESILTPGNIVMKETKEIGVDKPGLYPYRRYEIDYGHHRLILQVHDGDDAEQVALKVHRIIRSMPTALVAQSRKLTVLPKGIRFSGDEDGFNFGAREHIVIIHPDDYDAPDQEDLPHHRLTYRQFLYHEFGHGFTNKSSLAFRVVLSNLVLKNRERGLERGSRSYARMSWNEAIACAFENFESAPPFLQQIALNLLDNPRLTPEHVQKRIEILLSMD